MQPPLVYFVGSGPGDPRLITVRGAQCLAAADVVVYDHLVHPRLLRNARAEAERIDAGAAAPQPMEQEAISYLLADKAREGKIVVRLKWGDPFVFDDGGKEALFLHEQGIPFEVVPGVPAGLGAPTYAGVPLTYPRAGNTVTFVRGHEDEGSGLPDLEWGRLARLGGTIVCYLGPRQLPAVIQALVTHGRSKEEPAAVIYNGTLPTQITLTGSLDDLSRTTRDSQERRPAILVVGLVVALREHLRWFDSRPLFGKRILVTRSREQAAELVDRLEALGAEAIEAPTIQTLPLDDSAPLADAAARAATFDWIVFTSANGVDFFMMELLKVSDVRSLQGVRLCAIGPATAEHLADYGIRPDLVPREFRAEAVVDALRASGDLAGQRILLPRADIAREVVVEELKRAGAEVHEVAAYRTVPAGGDLDIYRMLLDRQIDVVTFTSASTVRNFVNILGSDAAPDLLHATLVASIGPVTAEAAEQLGIHTTIMPSDYTIPALVQAIADHFATADADRSG